MIFITGASGFVGQNLTKMLIQKEHEVLGLDFRANPNERHGKEANWAKFISGSTLDKSLISNVFSEYDIETVIHLGMISTPAQAVKNPEQAQASIIGGTNSLFELASQNRCKKFIHFSSSHVYGNANGDSFNEKTPLEPESLYGKIKKAAEDLLLEKSKTSKMITHIVRPTSLYGANDSGKRVVSLFIEKALSGNIIQINDPSSKLDFTYIDDFLSGVESLIFDNSLSSETFNLSRGKGRTLVELAEIIKKYISDARYEIVENKNPSLAKTRKGQLDISKARKLLDYNPTTDLEEGVRLILNLEGHL